MKNNVKILFLIVTIFLTGCATKTEKIRVGDYFVRNEFQIFKLERNDKFVIITTVDENDTISIISKSDKIYILEDNYKRKKKKIELNKKYVFDLIEIYSPSDFNNILDSVKIFNLTKDGYYIYKENSRRPKFYRVLGIHN